MLRIISVLLRSRYLYFIRVSSSGRTPSFWSPISKGGSLDLARSSALVMRTSISPVGLLSTAVPSTLFLTVPSMRTQDSREKVFMTLSISFLSVPAGRSSGSKTTWVIPYLSARSMNATPPWSLENLTQPSRQTCFPISEDLSSPQVLVLLIEVPQLINASRYADAINNTCARRRG